MSELSIGLDESNDNLANRLTNRTIDNVIVETAQGVDNQVYDSVCRVRSSIGHSRPTRFAFDAHSHHYRLSIHKGLKRSFVPVAALTVTRLLDGPIDCQQFYPTEMLIRFREQIGSACKLCVDPQRSPSTSLGRRVSKAIVRAAIRHQVQLGMRLDLINVVHRMVPYYRRHGYRLIEQSDFVHPTLGTASKVMWLAADPGTPSVHRNLFQDIANPLPLTCVESVLRNSGGNQQFEQGVSV